MSEIPDALMIPEGFKTGDSMYSRLDNVCTYAETTLGADLTKSQRAYVRKQQFARMFITLDPQDCIYFPTGHQRSGQPRYRWVKQQDGSEHGFLVEGAADAVSRT